MSPQVRALLIGLIGPLVQAVGVAWDLLEHGVFNPGGLEQITLQHIVSGPAHLMMAVGMVLSLLCIPVAVQVAAAQPEELELPLPSRPTEDEPLFEGRSEPAEAIEQWQP